MADKIVVIKLDVQQAGAEAQIVSLNSKLDKLTKGSEDYELILKKIAIQEDRLAQIQAKRAVASDKITKQITKQKDATGSATAATMELSRVVSDAPYGIRGMANNITQLVSQLGTASTKAGGLGNALKLMGKQMIGPLGAVFAITVLVSAIDLFWGANTKAEKSVEDMNKKLKEAILVLNGYETALDSSNLSLSEREGLIKASTVSNPKFLKIIKDSSSSLTEQTEALRELIKTEEKELDIKNKVAQLEAVNTFLREEEVESVDSVIKKRDELTKAREKSGFISPQQSQAFMRRLSNFDKIIGKYKEQKTLLQDINDLITPEGVEDYEKEGELGRLRANLSRVKKDRESRSNNIEEYKAYSEALKLIQKDIDKITGTKPKDREKVDVLGLDSVDIGENKKKMKKTLKAVADALGVDLKKNPLEIDTNLDLELSDEAKKIIADKLKSDLDILMLKSKLEDVKEFVDKSKAVLGLMTDFVSSEFDRELTIEQNKTNALNTELNNRLLNENLSKEQRKVIQNQIAQNDEKLRVKQEAIQRKAFNVTKAFQLAMAVADGASSVLKAYGSQLVIGDPTSIIRAAAAAKMAGAVALLNIATIARTKFQSSSPASPANASIGGGGSSGGGTARAEPSFNIVGRSQDNILLDAIQSQFDKPLKAYVVARDITNQQQLDGVISTSAST